MLPGSQVSILAINYQIQALPLLGIFLYSAQIWITLIGFTVPFSVLVPFPTYGLLTSQIRFWEQVRPLLFC